MKKTCSLMLAMALLVCSLFGCFGVFYQQQTVGAEATVYASFDPTYAEGGSSLGVVQETINYAYKVEDIYFNPYEFTNYGTSYTCGIHAAGNIIATYDRLYEELIPTRPAGKTFLGQWLWTSQDAHIDSLFSTLYGMMGSNPAGVTIATYKNGLTNYVTGRGRSISQTQCMSGGSLNSSQYKAALSSGKFMSVFMDGFAFTTLNEYQTYSGYDKVTHYAYAGAHVMAVYGYFDVAYYNAQNQCFRKDSYLFVTTGFDAPLCLVQINQFGSVDDGYIIQIY